MPTRSPLAHLRRPAGWGRAWLGVVLALAIALKLLVPQGWMPDRRGGLMLCSGKAPVAAVPGMAHGKHAKHGAPSKPVADHPCAFAGLGMAAAPPPPLVVVTAPAMTRDALPVVPLAVAVGRGLAAPPPPATGPPAFA